MNYSNVLPMGARVGNEERIEFGIESPRDGDDAVRRGEVDDLGVLEDGDAETESSNARPRHDG